jgi:hypothetical protein
MTFRRIMHRIALVSLIAGLGFAPLHAVEKKDAPKTAAAKKKAKKPAAARQVQPRSTTGGSAAPMSGYRNDYNIGNGY